MSVGRSATMVLSILMVHQSKLICSPLTKLGVQTMPADLDSDSSGSSSGFAAPWKNATGVCVFGPPAGRKPCPSWRKAA